MPGPHVGVVHGCCQRSVLCRKETRGRSPASCCRIMSDECGCHCRCVSGQCRSVQLPSSCRVCFVCRGCLSSRTIKTGLSTAGVRRGDGVIAHHLEDRVGTPLEAVPLAEIHSAGLKKTASIILIRRKGDMEEHEPTPCLLCTSCSSRLTA